MKATRKYDVKFNNPEFNEFNAVYEFERGESGAFAYGNRSMVIITTNGANFRNGAWNG